MKPHAKHNPLPGFNLTMGYTLFYLGIVVFLPLGAMLLQGFTLLTWSEFFRLLTEPRAVAAYKLSFGAAFVAALINSVFGSILAWVLVRYHFPGRRLVDAMVDFPFALPTAVAGLALSNLFSEHGWYGALLKPLGIKVAFTSLGVVVAMTFVGLPFIVRTLQPVLESWERDTEEAAAMLGAGRFRIFVSVIAPSLLPALLTGFSMAFARGVSEYGSVIFISNNIPGDGEIAPLLVFKHLEQYEFAQAIGVAMVLLIMSFLMLILINLLERRAARFLGQ